MYLDFFQLQKAPFHVTPDPDFFCSFPSHREALATLIYGVMLKKGFIALTGEVGVGKTTILRSFLKRIEQREEIKVIYLLNADVSFNDLLQTLLHEFDAIPASESAFMRVNQLHHILIDQFRQGRNVVLIVDEAQNMPVETLEGLRVLSNLETATDKLLQIVFCGQPEFDDKLERPELRQLKQRIAVRAVVRPLTEAEGIRYIQRRFSLAGATDRALFTPDALRRIVKEARGIPRLINILCDNALATACGYHEQQVKGRVAREIIADRKVRTRPRTGWWSVPVIGVAAAIMAAGVFLSGAIYFGLMRGEQQLAPVEPRGTQGGAIDFGLTQGPPPSPAETARLPSAPPSPDSVAAPTPAVLPVAPDAPTAEVAQTAAAELAAVTTGEPEPVTRVVKTGDRLTDLVEEVYGVRDEHLVQWVQRHNPLLKNSNLIRIGDRLVFPPANHQDSGDKDDSKALPSRVP
jgi:general secretion pathway protein A